MNTLLRDIRFGFRRLLKNPGLSFVIILTLGLCIGTTAALFSVVRAVFLDAFPYEGHERISLVVRHFPALEREEFTYSVPEFRETVELSRVFDAWAANSGRDVNLTGGERPERVQGVAMSASTFDMLGVSPALGRAFTSEEDVPGAADVVVISHRLWERRFGSSREIVGDTLEIDGVDHTLVGIMPERFLWWDSDVWFPLRLDPTASDRAERSIVLMARLRPGLDAEGAERELGQLAQRLEQEHGEALPEYRGMRYEVRPLLDEVIRNVRPALASLLWAVGFIFLIACANIANIQLAQAVAREREVAIRTALGADRARIVRQLVIEGVLLATLGGLLGFVLAAWGTDLVVGLIPYGYFPAETVVVLDHWTLLFSVGIGAAAGLVFGLAPAIHLTRSNVLASLREGARTLGGGVAADRARKALVIAEVALALVIVVGAGLMVQSFDRLTDVDMGFTPENAVAMQLDLPATRYGEQHQIAGFYDELMRRVEGLPGVEASGLTYALPLSGGLLRPVSIEGRSAADVGAAAPEAQYEVVTPGYFPALDVPLATGRILSGADTADSQPVAVVNRTFAKRFFPDQDPLGRRIKRGQPADEEFPWRTIVGVVGDVKQEGLEIESRAALYIPFAQAPRKPRSMALVVRSSQIAPLTEQVRRTVTTLDPEQPVFGVRPLEEMVIDSLGGRRLTVVLLTVFAILALILAGVGIFAIMAYSVGQRTQEMGVRLALGAGRPDLLRLVVGQGLRLAVAGIAFGVVSALIGGRLLASLIYGVGPRDPMTLAVVAALFTVIAALASYLPARRATRVDPLVALRER